MIRKVTHASFHNSSNFIPNGVGDIGKNLPSAKLNLEKLELTVSDLGLHAKYLFKGIKHENLFPMAAVALMTLAPEEGPSEKANTTKTPPRA